MQKKEHSVQYSERRLKTIQELHHPNYQTNSVWKKKKMFSIAKNTSRVGPNSVAACMKLSPCPAHSLFPMMKDSLELKETRPDSGVCSEVRGAFVSFSAHPQQRDFCFHRDWKRKEMHYFLFSEIGGRMNDETFTVPTICYTQEQGLFDKIHRYNTQHLYLRYHNTTAGKKKKTAILGFFFFFLFEKTNLCLYLLQICWFMTSSQIHWTVGFKRCCSAELMYCCFQPFCI